MSEISPVVATFFSKPLWLALIVSLAMIPILKLPAQKLGLVDHPGGRKQHEIPATLVGGAAILIAFYSTLVIYDIGTEFNGMLIATVCLFLIGLIDDKYDTSALIRLFLQTVIISTALWYDNVWLNTIPFTSSINLDLGIFAYPLTVLFILGLKNAINMLDGIDGLSSGVSLITLGFLIGIAASNSNQSLLLISSCLFGALMGFWAHNYRFKWRERASVFMGDSGSMILGFLLPYIAIKLSVSVADASTSPAVLIWLVAVPVWDIVTVVIKRTRNGKSPLVAGRDHIHHTLLNAGLNVRQILHLIYLLSVATASAGIAMVHFGLTALESYLLYFVALGLYVQRVNSLDKRYLPNDSDMETSDTTSENKIVNIRR